MLDIIKSQIKDSREMSNEIVKVRSFLLDNYGPFGSVHRNVITGEEETVDMVKKVIEKIKA